MQKLFKELTAFCVQNNVDPAKAGALLGMFIKHGEAEKQALRNKLTPIYNIVTLIENGQVHSTVDVGQILSNEIVLAKKVLESIKENV